ncbi:hypothetical protein NMG60_11000858 [Bertholletia excelsa]
MGIGDWHGSRSQSIRLGRSSGEAEQDQSHLWLRFWRKIKGERRKKKKNTFSSPVCFQGSYDQDTYLQNFDDGRGRMEPDNLYRSFSARFADPSRSFQRNGMLNVLD